MYRLVLYELLFLVFGAFLLSFFGLLSFSPASLAFSVAFIFLISWLTNSLFAWAFDAPSNPESTYITALILALIITPPVVLFNASFLALAFWASVLAIASKYILAIGKKHLFNPAALGVALTALVLGQSASWWVGTAWMLPFVLVGGFLVLRKLQRFDLFWSFAIAVLGSMLVYTLTTGGDILMTLQNILVTAPLFFFASVMLTEPLTTPPSRTLRIIYGALTGFFFAPFVHLGSFYWTPELALLTGNIFSYLASPKQKLVLALKERRRLTPDVYEFIFTPDKPLSFVAGQYLEWTLAHAPSDSRGIRRYLTIASSPTEKDIRIAVKFYPKGSTFKKKLLALQPGDTIVASQLAGDFVLPRNKKKKLAFIAGGIGITPFRSHIRAMLDRGEARDVVLFYANKTPNDVAYHQLFADAEEKMGMKTVYAFTDPGAVPAELPDAVPALTPAIIAREMPDFR